MHSKKGLSLGKIYFIYLFMVLFLQIIGFSSKGSILDTGWKALTIIIALFSAVNKCGLRIEVRVFACVTIYLLGQFLAFIFAPSFITADGFNVTWVLNIIIVVVMTYMFITAPTTGDFSISDIRFFLNAFLLLMIYAVIFNILRYPRSILNFMSINNVYTDMMHSFFDNKQTYGMFLFMAFIASMWMYFITTAKIYSYGCLLFAANLFICMSRTAMIACLVFLFMITIYNFNTDRRFAVRIILLVFFLILIILFVPGLRSFIKNVVMDTDSTMNARTNVWGYAGNLIHGAQAFFGYGESNVNLALGSVQANIRNSHNGLIHVMLTGGLLKLFVYILVLMTSFFNAIRVKAYDRQLGNLFLATFFGVFTYSMGESLVLLDTSSPCILASVMCLAFPIGMRKFYVLQQNNTATEYC